MAVSPETYLYIRMSTEEQLQGSSLDRQKKRALEYAKRKMLSLPEKNIYVDIGRSGYTGEHIRRGEFGRFLLDVEVGNIARNSILLVENFDRVSRENPTEALMLALTILKAGIEIITLHDEKRYDSTGSIDQLMMMVLGFGLAHQESAKKADRVGGGWTRGRAQLDAKRLTTVAPLWVRPDPHGSFFEPDQERVQVVKDIFKLSEDGFGAYRIARWLNQRGVKPWGKQPKGTRGRPHGWQPSYVKKILSNRAVLGEFQPHRVIEKKREPIGDPIPNYFPPVIDEATFYRVQAAIADRKTNGGGRAGKQQANLFKGLLFCAQCGSAVKIIDKGKSSKGGRYLTCDGGLRDISCTRKHWRYEEFESGFLHHARLHLGAMKSAEVLKSRGKDLDDRITVLKGEIGGLLRRADLWDEMIANDTATQETRAKRIAVDQDIIARRTELETLENERRRTQESSMIREGDIQAIIASVQDQTNPDLEIERARAAQVIARYVSRVDVSLEGVANFFTGAWREYLDADVEEDTEWFLADPRQRDNDHPAFAVRYRDSPHGAVMQTQPDDPTACRVRCPLKPTNYAEVDESEYRYHYEWNGELRQVEPELELNLRPATLESI